jgi:hypothetical protein
VLRQAADTFESLIQEARQQDVRLRALGSAWALTDIAVTDGWLINTKMLNGCFDLTDQYFEATYPEPKRPCWRWPSAAFPSTSSTSTSNGARTRPSGAP